MKQCALMYIAAMVIATGGIAVAESREWEFSRNGKVDGWWIKAGSSEAYVRDGVLTYVSDGEGSRISKRYIRGAEHYKKLVICLRSPVNKSKELSMSVEFKPDGTDEYEKLSRQKVAVSDDFTVVEFDTAQNEQWTGNIDTLRINLNGWRDSKVGNTFEIDYIRLEE